MNGTRKCLVQDCARPLHTSGYCSGHYQRMRRHGDPLGGAPGRRNMRADANREESAREHFWACVQKTETCWLWTASISPAGYGTYTDKDGRRVGVHRWSYEQAIGPIPEDLVLDHLCKTRNCVNPAHLEAVTDAENRRRGDAYALINGLRTGCRKGHEYTAENTVYIQGDVKVCRTCKNAQDRVYGARKRAEKRELRLKQEWWALA